ncbi:MAG TPA: polysaccharide deacetylase family protein [Solirubrobacteraceae bacterium]|nr:polysaccharide deacetylase family protein [Solirubrobacteraceae bacterium]
MDDGYSTLQEGPGRGSDPRDGDDRSGATGDRPSAGAGGRERSEGERNGSPDARPRRAGDRPRGPVAPHHRRRRAIAALLATAAVALVVGIVVGAAASGSHPAAHPAPVVSNGFFRRIKTLASGGAGSFVVDEQRAENQAITRTLAYTPYVRAAGTQHKEVALTFDDGPGPYTPDVLRVLVREHVPATFFEVGLEEHYFHAATAQIVARGYPIGDHTESHLPMSQLKRKAQSAQLIEEADAIGNYGAPFPRMFRPPYGVWDHTTLSLLRKYNMLMVLWSVDTDDYERPGVNVIVQRALAGLEPGAIILLHDAGGDRSQTVAALPRIVKAIRKRGYKLVTVPRLLLDNPAPKDQNVAGLVGAGG